MKLINISKIEWPIGSKSDLPYSEIINYTYFGFDEKYIYPDYLITESIESYLFNTYGESPVNFDWDVEDV